VLSGSLNSGKEAEKIFTSAVIKAGGWVYRFPDKSHMQGINRSRGNIIVPDQPCDFLICLPDCPVTMVEVKSSLTTPKTISLSLLRPTQRGTADRISRLNPSSYNVFFYTKPLNQWAMADSRDLSIGPVPCKWSDIICLVRDCQTSWSILRPPE
jgi:hypothetical protein